MGKSLPSPSKLHNFARIVASNRLNNRPNQIKPVASKARPVSSSEARPATPSGSRRAESQKHRLTNKRMEVRNSNSNITAAEQRRLPLSEVVADCVKRWFHDTLKEAKAGDSAMQVLVGQMYFSGYGVPKDAQKGSAWISRASKSRSSALKVGDKHPGYNASDSDSDDGK